MSEPQKYRPKVVEFEAMGPITPDNQDEIAEWCNGRAESAHLPGPGRGVTKGVRIRTLDGPITAPHGHYVFRCTDGSFAPCAPDFFAATYEAVSGDEPSTPVEINTPAVRQAISVAVHDEMAEEAAGLAPMVAGRVFVILDRASAGLPFDAAVVSE